DGIEVDGTRRLQAGQRPRSHAALADDDTDTVLADDLRLIRLLPDARGGSGRRHAPAVTLFRHHRTAVIENAAAEIHRGVVLHQVGVDGVAAGVDTAGDQHDVADLQRANLLFGD